MNGAHPTTPTDNAAAPAMPTPTNPPAVDPSWTREQALEEIGQAQSLEEVFAVANRAMGVQRQVWGDSFHDASRSAHLWANASFTVAAQDTLSLQTYFGRIPNVSAGALEAHALDSAKAFARAMLIPQACFDDRMGYVSSQLPEQIRQLNERHPLGRSDMSGVAKPDLISSFVGTQVIVAAGSEKATEALVRSRIPSWEGLNEFLNPPQDNKPDSGQGPEEQPFQRLVNEFGMSRVAVGPVGGIPAARARAMEAIGALGDMADLMKVPRQSLGLEGMALDVNQVFAGAGTEASYNFPMHLISTGRKTEHLGHEWTHAAERWADDHSTNPSLKQAMDKLRERVNNLRPDVEGLENEKALLESHNQGPLLLERLKTQGSWLTRLVAKRGKLPPAVSQALIRGRSPSVDINESAERLAQSYNRVLSRSAPQMSLDEAKMISKRDREAYQRYMFYYNAIKQGKSLFVARAESRDWHDKTHYWSDKRELLARASEPYFLGTSNPAVVANPDRTSTPHGSEREQTNQAFQEFMDVFAQHMHAQYPSQPTTGAPDIAHQGATPGGAGTIHVSVGSAQPQGLSTSSVPPALPEVHLGTMSDMLAARRARQQAVAPSPTPPRQGRAMRV